jgi:hypothetical protein
MGILAGIAVVSAQPSLAQGVNLAWTDCAAFGTVDKAFACNVSTGSPHAMVASASAPTGIDLFTGFAVVLDVKSSTDPLPDWWKMRNDATVPGQCRNGAITASADFTSNSNCADPFAGAGVGGIAAFRVGGPNYDDQTRIRITLAFALPAGQEIPLTPGTEYYVAKINISNAKTTGAGACGGCATPMSITLNGVQFAQPAGAPGGDKWVTDPLVNRTITWQGGIGAPALATTRPTWGQVKSLYR